MVKRDSAAPPERVQRRSSPQVCLPSTPEDARGVVTAAWSWRACKAKGIDPA